MTAEKFEKPRTIPEGLNPEEIKILQEINRILGVYEKAVADKKVSIDEYDEKQRVKINFKKELESKGIDPYEYYLFHRLIGSSEIKTKLDLPDHTIEKKIKEIYAEYV